MMKYPVSLALVMFAGGVVACPYGDKMQDAKAEQRPSVAASKAQPSSAKVAAVPEQAKQTLAAVDKKAVKPTAAKKSTT